jgi:BlaI family penicillinase repressor
MSQAHKISEAEWHVMKVLWKKAPLCAQEVAEQLTGTSSRNPKTVKTLINRLVAKKILGFKKVGRLHFFEPLLTEAECALEVSESFLDRVFGGSLQPLVAQFVRHQKLSAQDIEELQEILRSQTPGKKS